MGKNGAKKIINLEKNAKKEERQSNEIWIFSLNVNKCEILD
jgi:hypothetical protein